MSWVSILEDAITRFESHLHMLQKETPPNDTEVPVERLREVRLAIARGEAILLEAMKHLDMATDPSLDIAAALRSSEDGKHELGAKIWEYDKTCRSLMQSLNRERARADRLQQAFDELKVEKNRLEKRLEEAMRKGSVYDAYLKGIDKKAGLE
jgi:predicted RNase H-like nuclease (RuvC/YqgF family)